MSYRLAQLRLSYSRQPFQVSSEVTTSSHYEVAIGVSQPDAIVKLVLNEYRQPVIASAQNETSRPTIRRFDASDNNFVGVEYLILYRSISHKVSARFAFER